MPAATTHPDYTESLPVWNRIEDCLQGQDAIRKRRETYLPKLTGQEAAEYLRYLNRAVFFNATGRTHEAMLGFLFRKPPTLELPPALDALAGDADLTGAPIMAYARRVASAVCGVGRAVTVVDWSEAENRPYFAFYSAANVINWRVERIGGNAKLVLLVLREYAMDPGNDGFEHRCTEQFRVLRINADGYYETSVHRNATGGDIPVIPGTGPAPANGTLPGYDPTIVREAMVTTRRGIGLDFIPAVFHNAEHPGESIGKAPLVDISSVNISQFQTSADLELGRHVCGLPTPWARCFGEDSGKLYMGMSHAWSSDNAEAACGILEFTGTGLGELTKAMEEKQQQMAALGARLIEPRGGDAEAYDTVALRASAETSTLARVGMLISESLSQALRMAAWWLGSGDDKPGDEIRIVLNKDFSSAAMPPTMVTALVGAWQQGAISMETLFHNFQKGEMFPEGRTLEEEKDSIDANPPGGGMMMPPPGKPPVPAKE